MIQSDSFWSITLKIGELSQKQSKNLSEIQPFVRPQGLLAPSNSPPSCCQDHIRHKQINISRIQSYTKCTLPLPLPLHLEVRERVPAQIHLLAGQLRTRRRVALHVEGVERGPTRRGLGGGHRLLGRQRSAGDVPRLAAIKVEEGEDGRHRLCVVSGRRRRAEEEMSWGRGMEAGTGGVRAIGC
jgi:hypothetical protein